MKHVVCIAGPTASGKSAWALSLAKKYNGEIVNADALQVYRDLQIISARPSPEDMQAIPHHLYGHIDGAQRYSTGQWLREVLPVVFDILSRKRMPILVGGTGLYFKALTEGLANIPDPSPEGQARAQRLYSQQGIEALRVEAERLDPVATQRVLGRDPQRLLRIVSVVYGTEKTLSQWQLETRPVIPRAYWVGAILLPERQDVYDHINRRFEAMMKAGGLDEVRALYARGLSVDLPVMKAIGVSQFADYMTGDIDLDDSMALAKRDSRRFAKRQYTWFRGQFPEKDEKITEKR